MSRVRIKICGITRSEDARAAVALGADALGFVFYEPSPRNVDLERASAIVAELPPFVSAVGVFVDPDTARVEEVLSEVRLDVLQFHGDERPEDCERFGRPYLKSIRMKPGIDPRSVARAHAGAQALLFDAYVPDKPGGAGQTFDWSLVPSDLDKPVVLAGGLTADNVADAIRRVQPYGVDVSGGVEGSRKGVKDLQKMQRFIGAVQGV
ncbi:MAG: phosphoribosylanthranilate isomerase [Gammaproteobacteria bacterium]|nr:phosphoribosylanthranilate isomerase [Gammaproteobacteria bacterium]